MRCLLLKVYDFTVPELNMFRTYCNFTDVERTLFEYRAKNIPLEKCAELMKSLSEGGEYTITDEMKAQLVDFYGNFCSEDRRNIMDKYVKKPVVIEAVTYEELIKNGHGKPIEVEYNGYIIKKYDDDHYIIPTLEGDMLLGKDDMLITGVDGEIYPCKKEIFEKTYEKV